MLASSARGVILSSLAAVFGLALPGCVEPESPEAGPDLAPLAAIYASPAGTLDAAAPDPYLARAEAQLIVLGAGKAELSISRMVEEVDRAVRKASLTPAGQAVPLRVDGVARLELPCGDRPGETAHLGATVDDGKLSSLIWGEVHTCPLWTIGTLKLFFGGTLAIYRYPDGGILVRIDGANTDDRSPLVLDFRIVGGRLESRVETARGDVIASPIPSTSTIELRTATGTLVCDREKRRCR